MKDPGRGFPRALTGGAPEHVRTARHQGRPLFPGTAALVKCLVPGPPQGFPEGEPLLLDPIPGIAQHPPPDLAEIVADGWGDRLLEHPMATLASGHKSLLGDIIPWGRKPMLNWGRGPLE